MKNKLIFAIAFLTAIFLISSLNLVKAQEISPTPTSDKAIPAKIEYDLAFPGILPDHPLYKLKVLRDKVISASIFNPAKKIEYLLLQTDKGILAAAILIDKNKIDLAESTALKAENNFTLISTQLYMLPKKPNKDFFKRLETAGLKHQEVLKSIVNRVPKNKQKVFEIVIDFSKRNLKTIEEYRTQQ